MRAFARRFLVHAAIVFSGLFAFGWLLVRFAEAYFNDSSPGGSVTLETGAGPAWVGPARFALFGLAVLAVVEVLALAKERAFRRPPAGSSPGQ
jgi:hypothetical protein